MVIVKNRENGNGLWLVYHAGIASDAETDYIHLESDNAAADDNSAWNDTAPTSSVFSVGTSVASNQDGKDIIAYCFHSVKGYSKIGNYTGNYNVDGPFVFTGFRPAWVLIKSAVTNGYAWYIMDSTRTTHNGSQNWLSANQTLAEDTSTGENVDFLSNGFKIRTNWTRLNDSGSPNYIYLAFAEAPFKFSNAR